MAIGRRALLVAALLPVFTATANAKPAVPTCALGKLPAPLRTLVPASIERGQARFSGSAKQTYATGVAAYLYGMPTVLTRLTVQTFPKNQLVGIGQLTTPATRTVVAPNHDTLYTVSQVDLSAGPVVIDAPASPNRYAVLQLLDAYTNAFAYIGSGADRNHASTVVLVPPGWQGSLPAGARVVHSPTKLVWLLGRTLIDSDADLPAAKAVMAQYQLTPLAAWLGGKRVAELVLAAFPGRPPVVLPTGLAFFDALKTALAADPPPPSDDCAVKAFARIRTDDPAASRPLIAAAKDGDKLVTRASATLQRAARRAHNGWVFTAPDTGRFGTDFAYRAVIAKYGLGANVNSEALYPNTTLDQQGRPLSGKHNYLVTFPAGELPPVRAFWSLTLYDTARFLVANPIDRYAVGDRTSGLRYGRGRSLTIYVSHDQPPAAQRANWLPAPKGHFSLYLRLYEPKAAATNGRWQPPTVSRVR
jgi:hypothetical protein